MKKQLTAHLVFAVTAIASQPSWALGFGRVVPDAVLGQTLTFTVPVRVEPGERFGAECVSAQVYFGDAVLASNLVRTSVDRGNGENLWLVRVTTLSPVVEPVVEIAVSAGCERRFERRFTAFADPPSLPAQPAIVAQGGGGVSMPGSSEASALAPVPGDGGVGSGGGRSTGTRGSGRAATAAGAASRPRVIRKGPTMALANELKTPPAQRDVNAARPDAGKARAAGPRVAETQSAAASRLVLDGGYSRLKLDMEEPMLPPPLSPAAAASLSESDDADVQQLHALERSIQAMKKVDQSQREQTARLQAQLADAQSDSGWMPWLLGLLALAVAAIAFLAWKLRQQAKLAHSAWFTESQIASKPPAPPAPVVVVKPAAPVPVAPPTLVAELGPTSMSDELVGGAVVGEVTDSQFDAAVDVAATAPLDRAALAGMMAGESSIPRELSVEELLDLEQQADFFIALGQEDAAVDLLMSHLRSAGGQSPLPYTKLLEIYRRQDDRAAYERTRARFNRRFNAYAPDWDTGPGAGRLLEDYPETIARVQAAWHAPIDAMAMLEALLFKREEQGELFDLPAYRDILVLYSLARDLWQHEGSGGTQVDVLLPLEDAGHPAYAAPAPYAEPSHSTEPVPLYGLDLPSAHDEPDSFVMTGYQPAHEAEAHRDAGVADLDLDLPGLAPLAAPEASRHDEPVHLTLPDLDAFSLAPIEPTKPPAAPSPDWELGDPSSDPSAPKKR